MSILRKIIMKRVSIRCLLVLGFLFTLLGIVGWDQNSPASLSVFPPSYHDRIGVYLTSHAINKPRVLQGVLAAVSEQKLNAVVINVKNMHGELTYESSIPLASTIGASSGRLEFHSLLTALREAGIYLIARQVLFYDPKLAAFLGISGSWVSADDERAVAYNLEVAQEVARLGFDEIQFDYVRFPDEGELLPIYERRYKAVNGFLQQARQELPGRIVLSADVFGRVLWDWNKKRIDPIGQSLEEMASCIDLISPMLYPSHYVEQYYKDNPYQVVMDALSAGKDRVSTPLRPFLQVFARAIPYGMSLETYIREQIRAAKEMGADGYLFWSPSCDYEALYRALD